MKINEEKMLIVICNNCGFRLGIQEKNIEEVSAGVWGPINCPHCKTYLNDLIKNEFLIKPTKHDEK